MTGYKVIAYCVVDDGPIFSAVNALKGLVSSLGFAPNCSSKEMVQATLALK
ncbi:MAG: hypothetical protein KGZ41_05470 [Dethiobacter sp.]|jgi:hypothetical protein|nr:hypothetical protein [Dethiobacter sp.]